MTEDLKPANPTIKVGIEGKEAVQQYQALLESELGFPITEGKAVLHAIARDYRRIMRNREKEQV